MKKIKAKTDLDVDCLIVGCLMANGKYFKAISVHSTHFQVGAENPNVERRILLNLYEKHSHILLSL